LVLVDAPCTGTGTWRRRPDAKWRLSDRQLDKRMTEQDAVLDQAARFVRPGGRLVYITCSVLAAENEARVAAFLDRRDDGFKVADATAAWDAALPESSKACRPRPVGGGTALALTPRISGTDGFFFAMLERT
ncbi:MFS transporter, partial [Aurantimonas sp. LRZ36]|nr:MFS transporter [Aurantimonas marianensis]